MTEKEKMLELVLGIVVIVLFGYMVATSWGVPSGQERLSLELWTEDKK